MDTSDPPVADAVCGQKRMKKISCTKRSKISCDFFIMTSVSIDLHLEALPNCANSQRTSKAHYIYIDDRIAYTHGSLMNNHANFTYVIR